MRRAVATELLSNERATLKRLVRAAKTLQRLVKRGCVVLLAAGEMENKGIAREIGIARGLVAEWRKRFAEKRLAASRRTPRGRAIRARTGLN